MSDRDLPSDLPTDLPALDADSLALLRGGSELSQVRDDGRARLSARVMSSIAAIPGGGGGGSSSAPGSAPTSGTAATKAGSSLGTSAFIGMGVTFAIGAALGIAARPMLGIDEHMQNAPIVATAIPEQHAPIRTLEPIAPSVAAVEDPPAPSSVPSAKSGPVRDLSAERALLDGARAALGRGDPAAAVVAAKTHEQRFPRGALAEEREALYVQALAQSGKVAEARARAAKFKQNYPDSMLLPAVTAATQDKP